MSRRLTVFTLANALLGSTMIGCLAAGILRLGQSMDWAVSPEALASLGESAFQAAVIVGVFLVALEVQLTRRLQEPYLVFSRDWIRVFFVEWFFLLLSLLLMVWAGKGMEFAGQEIRVLSSYHLMVFLKPEYAEGLVLLLVAWSSSRILVGDLMALEDVPSPASNEPIVDPVGVQTAARTRLWENVFAFGTALVVISKLFPAMFRSLRGLPISTEVVGWEVLVYFLCALALLAVSRWHLLQADWIWERTPVAPGLQRKWTVYSLGFLGLIVLLAAALPTAYTFDLLASLNLVLQGFLTALLYLFLLAAFPFYLLIALWYLLAKWLGGAAPEVPPPIDLEPMSLPQGGGESGVPVLREILFWILILVLLTYALRAVFRGRWALLRRAARWPAVYWLLSLWNRIWKSFRFWGGELTRAVRESWQGIRMEIFRRSARLEYGYLSLRGLSPRQRIRFYFLALIRRGGEQGFFRRPSQTPREYVRRLADAHQPIEDELREMESAFEEARYTRHDVGIGQARHIREVWDTIRTRLRSSGKDQETGKPA